MMQYGCKIDRFAEAVVVVAASSDEMMTGVKRRWCVLEVVLIFSLYCEKG